MTSITTTPSRSPPSASLTCPTRHPVCARLPRPQTPRPYCLTCTFANIGTPKRRTAHMPKLAKHEIPEAKLDAGAAAIDAALSAAQKQGLFEKPGSTVFAIVELTSVSYTGHADDEGKTPQVKLRVHRAEVARDDEEAASLAEAQRAMYRRRRMDNTLDEVGAGPQGAEDILAADFAGYPSEAQFKEHKERQRTRDLHNAPR